MNKLKLDLKSCYGIGKLTHTLNFENTTNNRHVSIIYAPNGTMKSSLAKVFKNYHNGKIEDRNIFNEEPSCQIWFDDELITEKDPKILVFDPFKDNENINIDNVLVSDEALQQQYADINKKVKELKDNLFAAVKKDIKVKRTFDFESNLLTDYGYSKDDLFVCLKEMQDYLADPNFRIPVPDALLKYETLLDKKVTEYFQNPEQADLIAQYEAQYKALLKKSNYLGSKGFDQVNLSNINTALSTNRFFDINGKIILLGKDGITKEFNSKEEVDEFLQKEKDRILASKELQSKFDELTAELDKNAKMQAINEVFKSCNELVNEYADIQMLKKKFWVTAFADYSNQLDNLLAVMEDAASDIKKIVEEAKTETRQWQIVIDEFQRRFFMPFRISVANQHNVIINGDLPSLSFTYVRGNKKVSTTEEILTREVLSFGEVRALKILNMLFKIYAIQKKGEPYLLVFDDIADSFDYRNKYAIVEYIRDLADIVDSNGERQFSILVLTHNFDFYRTVAGRLGAGYDQVYFASKDDDNKIDLRKGEYLGNVFKYFGDKIKQSTKPSEGRLFIISSIPFVRNIIEYRYDDNNPDYLKMTDLLHIKADTSKYTLADIEKLFQIYWRNDINFDKSILKQNYLDFLFSVVDGIDDKEDVRIENKIALSIAIRLKAELYMLRYVLPQNMDSNQTAELISSFKNKYLDNSEFVEPIKILSKVSMMTPENIHMNSFMYEPILDISSKHLYQLYQDIKSLK